MRCVGEAIGRSIIDSVRVDGGVMCSRGERSSDHEKNGRLISSRARFLTCRLLGVVLDYVAVFQQRVDFWNQATWSPFI